MFFAPFQLGVDFLVSYKAKQIIYDFNLPIHNKIPAKIDTFQDDYFLLGFPIWNFEIVDFSKSVFYHRDKGHFSFLNYEDYENSESKYRYSTVVKLKLNKVIKYDVIHIRGMVFFSENLLKELSLNNITGYSVSVMFQMCC
ncbi:hypothetical protein ACILD6_06355 [Capnocytophaga canimorsus]|uniref:hypothetical protein n=1 Tax=Capnocytophaga canimorsus TaxID=28188 RepID=UPI0037D8E1B8